MKDGETFVAATRVWVTSPRAGGLQRRVAALRARLARDRPASHRTPRRLPRRRPRGGDRGPRRSSPSRSTRPAAATTSFASRSSRSTAPSSSSCSTANPDEDRVVLMEPKLRVEGATKVYEGKSGPVHALDDISLDVAEGELVYILGPSGCGKTTLLWAMSGLHALTSGRDHARRHAGRRALGRSEIGMIFQDANLLPWRNLPPEHRVPVRDQEERRSTEERVDALLQRDGLDRVRAARCRASSRAACSSAPRSCARSRRSRGAADGRAVRRARRVHARRDEPRCCCGSGRRRGKTIVFVTHNISEAIFLADRVVVLTPRPGRLAHIYDIELPRPRTIEMTFEPDFIELVQEMKRTVETGGQAVLEVDMSNVPSELRDDIPSVRQPPGVERSRADRLDRAHVGAHGEERARDRRRSSASAACDLLRARGDPPLDGHADVRLPEADGRRRRALATNSRPSSPTTSG